MSTVGQGGLKGLPPKVSRHPASRPKPPPVSEENLQDRVRNMMVGRTITAIAVDDHTLTMYFDNGTSFTMQNSGGWAEVI